MGTKYDLLIDEFRKQFQSKNYKEAAKFAKKAIISDPHHHEAWAMLANLYLYQFQAPEEALRIIKRAQKYHPKNLALEEVNAYALFKSGSFQESFNTFQTILKSEPDNSVAWDAIDKIYASSAPTRQAIDTLRNSVFTNHLNKGRNLFITSRFDEALEFFQKAIQIIPSNLEVLDDLARLYFQMKNFGASLTYVNQLLVKNPKDTAMLNLKGYNLWAMKNHDDAFESFEKSLKIKPGQSEIITDFEKLQLELANIYNNEGDAKFRAIDYDEALRIYQKCLHYHKGDTYALQRINEVRGAVQKRQDQKKEQETLQVLQYLANESQTNEEILIEDILREMPSHEDVKDETSLRNFIKQLILNQRMAGALTPDSLKFTRGGRSIENIQGKNISAAASSSHMQYKTVLLKQAVLPIIILRDGFIEPNGYHFNVKIQNNHPHPIREVKVLIIFPESYIICKTENPISIPIIHPNNLKEITFDFTLKSSIIEGIIHTAVIYVDNDDNLQIHQVSGHQVENFTSTIRPLQMDPQRLAGMLQQMQQFPVNQDKFTVNMDPNSVFKSVQQQLQGLHFHIIRATNSDAGGQFIGYITASGQPSSLNQPVFVEAQINGFVQQSSTEVLILSRTASAQLSKIMTNTVKGSLIMPKCKVCDQFFPMSLYSKLRKGEKLVCEYCGSPFTS